MASDGQTAELCALCRYDFVSPGDGHEGSERCAQQRILRWCRSNPRGEGIPVMRNVDWRAYGGPCVVLDVNQTEPKPGGKEWERRDRKIAAGGDWRGVLAELLATGRKL